jgi:hypothetical protein
MRGLGRIQPQAAQAHPPNEDSAVHTSRRDCLMLQVYVRFEYRAHRSVVGGAQTGHPNESLLGGTSQFANDFFPMSDMPGVIWVRAAEI